MKKAKPKRLNERVLTGSMLVEFVQNVLNAINAGAIPVIEDSWRYIIKNECIKSTKELFNKFFVGN